MTPYICPVCEEAVEVEIDQPLRDRPHEEIEHVKQHELRELIGVYVRIRISNMKEWIQDTLTFGGDDE